MKRNKKNRRKKEYPYKNKKYYCSIHGGEGNPDCEECKEKLKLLCKDNNAYLTGDFK